MTHDELRAWAAAHAPEMPQAVAVLALLAERDRLRAALGALRQAAAMLAQCHDGVVVDGDSVYAATAWGRKMQVAANDALLREDAADA